MTILRSATMLINACLLSAIACTAVPTIEAGICGNGVLDPGEDCDSSFDLSGNASCAAPDEALACHYTCDGDSECPQNWSCGQDSQCRLRCYVQYGRYHRVVPVDAH